MTWPFHWPPVSEQRLLSPFRLPPHTVENFHVLFVSSQRHRLMLTWPTDIIPRHQHSLKQDICATPAMKHRCDGSAEFLAIRNSRQLGPVLVHVEGSLRESPRSRTAIRNGIRRCQRSLRWRSVSIIQRRLDCKQGGNRLGMR